MPQRSSRPRSYRRAGGGSGDLPEVLALVPADSEYVEVYDLELVRSEEVPSAVWDEDEDLGYLGLEDIGVLTGELTTLAFAFGGDWALVVLEGDIDFVHVRDQLEDRAYEDDTYREVELWEGGGSPLESAALFEDRGRIVIGDSVAVRSVLRMLDRGSGSLLGDEDSYLGRALKRAGSGWVSFAEASCLGDYDIRGCRAVGLAFRRGDGDHLVEVTIAVLFRDERTAESGMDELERQIEADRSFEFDIDDVRLDGDFVIVTASGDEEDVLGEESSAPGTPAATARAGASGTDAGDDHGDSTGEATFVTVGDAVPGAVGHRRDVDYFAFAAERGKTYRIDVDLVTLDDSVMTLFDSDSQELEFDDDDGESLGSRITWTAAESATHYVAVAAWGNNTGSYILTVTALRAAPGATDGSGTPTASTGGTFPACSQGVTCASGRVVCGGLSAGGGIFLGDGDYSGCRCPSGGQPVCAVR